MTRSTRVAATAFVLGLALGCGTDPGAGGPDPLTVHAHQNPTHGLVNQYLVETATGLVAIDGGFLRSDVEAIERRIDSIGKPLTAILVTHAHLDHINGLARLARQGQVPVYAAPRTILEHETHTYRTRLPHLVALYPDGEPRFTPVRGGFAHRQDGVEFRMIEMGPGESEWDVVWLVDGGERLHAFVGDLLLNHVHGFFQSGQSAAWMASLADLTRLLPEEALVYAGHGEMIAGVRDLQWQWDYIDRMRREVAALAGPSATLDQRAEGAFHGEVTSWLPTDRLEFLILMGADVLASELTVERERRRVDEKLATLSGG